MDKLISAIHKGKVEAVYCLDGDPYPRGQVLAALRQAVVGGEESAFNLEVMRAPEARSGGILGAARTLPMLGDRQLVLVHEVDKLEADDLRKLVPYVQNPSPTTCLVLVTQKADKRLKLFKQLHKKGWLHSFPPLKDRQVPAWLTREARRRKVTLGPGAAERIADSVGRDMGSLAMAMEQLVTYVGPGQPVMPEHVEELLAQTREQSIFDFTNAVGRGQRREALLLLRRMMADRESGIRIVAMLARHLRQVWSIAALDRKHTPRDAMARQVGVHPYFVGDLVKQASRWSPARLRSMHRALFEADRTLKSSPLSDAVVLERLVNSVCPPR